MVVAVVGMTLDGEATALETAGLDDATVIGGTVASVDEAGAETATTAADDELELTAEFPPDVHAVTNTSSEVRGPLSAPIDVQKTWTTPPHKSGPRTAPNAPHRHRPLSMNRRIPALTSWVGAIRSTSGESARVPLWISTERRTGAGAVVVAEEASNHDEPDEAPRR